MEWIDIFIKLLKKHALPAPFVYCIFTNSSAIADCNISKTAKIPYLAISVTNPSVTLAKDAQPRK